MTDVMPFFGLFWLESFGAGKKRLAARGSRLGLADAQISLPRIRASLQNKICHYIVTYIHEVHPFRITLTILKLLARRTHASLHFIQF